MATNNQHDPVDTVSDLMRVLSKCDPAAKVFTMGDDITPQVPLSVHTDVLGVWIMTEDEK
jgi:hypothetical protein